MSVRVDAPGAPEAVRVIAGREFLQYFDSKIAYVFTIAFILLANSVFMNEFFLSGLVDMTRFFESMELLLPLFVPAVTMRLWAEERKTRTIELLLTLPIRTSWAVLGKFVAAVGLFLVALAGTLPIPCMLEALGDPDLGRILAGYVGVVLCGACFLSLGMLVSSLSSDQIVTFVATSVACYLLVLLGREDVQAVLDGLAPALEVGTRLRETVSVTPRLEAFREGAVTLDGVVFFVGLTALFLWTNAIALERIRE